MNRNEEKHKHNSAFSDNEHELREQIKIQMRSHMIKNLSLLLYLLSILGTIILISIDIIHFIFQFCLYQFSSRRMQQNNKNYNIIIFFQQLLYLVYYIVNFQCEKEIKYFICDVKKSTDISSSYEKTQNNDDNYVDFLKFCESEISWYHIQGQLIYFYLQGQESFFLSLFTIASHFISGIVCYQDVVGTHILLFFISAFFLFQKKNIQSFSEQNDAVFEQTYQKYEFWKQFVYKYAQNDIFIAQLTPTSSQTTQSESNECFDLKQLDAHSGLSAIAQDKNRVKSLTKKSSISYKCTQYQQNQVNFASSIAFPFMNLNVQSKTTFRDDYYKQLSYYLNKYIFRKFRRKESPVMINPHKSLIESRINFKNQQKLNGYSNSNNMNSLNEHNIHNNYLQGINANSRQHTNQNIQITSHIQTNQHEETIQFDSHPIHFSSFNHLTTQNKNNSNQCIYLLQNSSMQHITPDHNTKSNFKNGSTNQNTNGRGSIHNPILKRNTIQAHFNLQNYHNSERKNSLIFQGSNSPRFINLNQLDTGVKSNDQIKNKGEGISIKKNDTQEGIQKKENKEESPLKDMEGETLLSLVKRNLIEHQLFEQNQIDKVVDKLKNKKKLFNFFGKSAKPTIKESKLGEQNVYVFEKQSNINDGLGDTYNPQNYQVNCIQCMYNGKDSLLVTIEEIKSHYYNANPTADNRLIYSPPHQNNNNNSDNLKIKTFKQKIISSLAHELKTPLNSIISQVNQMLVNKNEKKVLLDSHEFQILKSNASLLNYKIEDLLNYSMYLQGENKMNIEKFSIQEIMNEMIEIFKPQAKLKQLYFHSKISLLQPSIKKSLELKTEKSSSPIGEVNQDQTEDMQNNIAINLDNPSTKDYQFCPVSEFKKRFVSLKFMSEKIINTPVSEIYSNVSVPSSQQPKEQQQLSQQNNNNDQFYQSSGNTISSPLKQPDVLVRSDKKKLICILINLLTNALKFTFKGGVSFTVNQLDKYTFEFTVTDTGIGIGEKLVKKMNNTNIEDYDTIFMNDSFDDQEVSEELEDSIMNKDLRETNNKANIVSIPNVISELSNIQGIDVEKKSEGEDSIKEEHRTSIFQQESKQKQIQNQHNIKRILDIKDICSINSSSDISQQDAVSELDKENNLSKKEELDKHDCSISLLAAQETQKKFNMSIFSNNNQIKQVSQYKSQPSLYNFQRNCGIGIKLVKILSSQLSSDKYKLKIKSKESQGSTFTFILQDLQQQSKVSLSQFIINDKNLSKKNIISDNFPKQNREYFLTNPYRDEIILSDNSLESHNNIKSQSLYQKTNTNRSSTSIAEFIDFNRSLDNIGQLSPKHFKAENIRKSAYKKNKSDLDFLANQNLLNQNSLKLQILLSNKKILIVDDMPFNIEILKNYLKGVEKLEIKEAFNGVSAVELVKNEKFDLILMDINMPLMDGIEATQEINQLIQFNQISPVPIIIVSAYTATQDIQNSLQSGAAGHVSKPISLVSLISEIHKVMSNN